MIYEKQDKPGGDVHFVAVDLRHLRALRLFHWRHAVAYSRITNAEPDNNEARRKWNEHMGAVQTLNSLFVLGDTAERDAERVDNPTASNRPASYA